MKNRTYCFFGEITEESVKDAIETIDSYELSEGDNFNFIINSNGGDDGSAKALSFYLNQIKVKNIVAVGIIASSAFDVFCNCMAESRIIEEGTIGIVHLVGAHLSTRYGKDKDTYDTFLAKSMEKENLKYCETLRAYGLSEKDIKKIKQGKDVYLSDTKLRQLKLI